MIQLPCHSNFIDRQWAFIINRSGSFESPFHDERRSKASLPGSTDDKNVLFYFIYLSPDDARLIQ
jgi:hypothetical protein